MLQVDGLVAEAGTFRIGPIGFEIPESGCVAIMGRTGSGKTTLLESICGLRRIESGRVLLDGIDITNREPGRREIGFVPQDVALFRSMSVREHLEFGPRLQNWKRTAIRDRVTELAEQLQIVDLLDRKPRGLSGGESKRVALGRAIASRPKLLCLDECLSGLDDDTHTQILDLLRDLVTSRGLATLHITHRRSEAEALAGSQIVTIGTAAEVSNCL